MPSTRKRGRSALHAAMEPEHEVMVSRDEQLGAWLEEDSGELVRCGRPPAMGSTEFQDSPAFKGVQAIAAFSSKNPKTVRTYTSRWNFFVEEFCNLPEFDFNPWLAEYAAEIFLQFAGWMQMRGTM